MKPEALQGEIRVTLARLSLAAGDPEDARRWYELFTSSSEGLFPSEQERADLLAARLELAEGKPDQALRRLMVWQTTARRQGRILSEVEILCLEALAYFEGSNLPQAAQALEAALEIAQPKGLRQLFLDEGRRMAVLLRASLPGFQRHSLVVFASALLRAMGPERSPDGGRTPDPVVLVEPLSARELELF